MRYSERDVNIRSAVVSVRYHTYTRQEELHTGFFCAFEDQVVDHDSREAIRAGYDQWWPG